MILSFPCSSSSFHSTKPHHTPQAPLCLLVSLSLSLSRHTHATHTHTRHAHATHTHDTHTRHTHATHTRAIHTHTLARHTHARHTHAQHTHATHTRDTHTRHTRATHTHTRHTRDTHTHATHTHTRHTHATHTAHTTLTTHTTHTTHRHTTRTRGHKHTQTRTHAETHTRDTHTHATHTRQTHMRHTHATHTHTRHTHATHTRNTRHTTLSHTTHIGEGNNLVEYQARWIVPGDRASLTAEEAMFVEKSLVDVEISEDDRDFVRGEGVRLGLSAERENRVCSFDSLILALNKVMLKVRLRAGLITTWTSLLINLCGPEPHPTCGIFRKRCFPHAKVEVRHTGGIVSVRWFSRAPVGRIQGAEAHRVAVTSLTDSLKRSLHCLRFPVVAAQSKNECSLRFLHLFGRKRRKSSIMGFLEKETGGPFAFSEAGLAASNPRRLDGSRVTGEVAGRDRRRCASLRLDLPAVLDIFKGSHGQPHGAASHLE